MKAIYIPSRFHFYTQLFFILCLGMGFFVFFPTQQMNVFALEPGREETQENSGAFQTTEEDSKPLDSEIVQKSEETNTKTLEEAQKNTESVPKNVLKENFNSNSKSKSNSDFDSDYSFNSTKGNFNVQNFPFRRVYIPEELLSSIPTHGETYWPIPGKEFEILLKNSFPHEHEKKTIFSSVFAEKAIYHARLENEVFLTGDVEFHLQHILTNTDFPVSPLKNVNAVPMFYWLFPRPSFVIEGPIFLKTPTKTENLREFSFFPEGNGEICFFPEDFSSNGSGNVHFAWSQVCSYDEKDSLSVNLCWIPANSVEWLIELPPEWIPETKEGIVSLCKNEILHSETGIEANEKVKSNRSESNQNPKSDEIVKNGNQSNISDEIQRDSTMGDSVKTKEKLNTWKILFGGKNQASIHFRPIETPELAKTPVLESQKCFYQLRKDGLDLFVQTNLKPLLDSPNIGTEPIRNVCIKLDGNLIPVSVRFNGVDAEWRTLLYNPRFSDSQISDSLNPHSESQTEDGKTSIQKADDSGSNSSSVLKESDGTFLLISLPGELPLEDSQLEIHAIGNLTSWLTDEPTELHPLPGIHFLDVLRSESQVLVEIFSPLELTDFSLKNADLLSNIEVPGQNQVQLRYIENSEDAQFHLGLTCKTPQLGLEMATALDFQEHEITAVTELLASVENGECFEILGIVDRTWTIDSVETSELLADFINKKKNRESETTSIDSDFLQNKISKIQTIEDSYENTTDGPITVEDWDLLVSPESVHQGLSDLDPSGILPGKITAEGWNLETLGILRIQLKHSIRPGHPVALRIRTRRLGYSNNFTFTGVQLAPLFFPTYRIDQSWILCGSSNAWKIHFIEPYRQQDVYWDSRIKETGLPEFPVHSDLPESDSRFPETQGVGSNSQENLGLPNSHSGNENLQNSSSESIPVQTPRSETSHSASPNTEPPLKKSESLNSEEVEPGKFSLLEETSSVKPAVENLNQPSTLQSTENIQSEEKNKNVLAGGFPTLAEIHNYFPSEIPLLTGIQDFKNIPMLRLERCTKEFSVKIQGFYEITSNPNAIYRISCNPMGTELERLHVMIRPGVLTGVSWKFPRSLNGSEAVCIEKGTGTQLEDLNLFHTGFLFNPKEKNSTKSIPTGNLLEIPSESSLNSSYELWEITFPQPQREPFEFELVIFTQKTISENLSPLYMGTPTITQEKFAVKGTKNGNIPGISNGISTSPETRNTAGNSESTGNSLLNYSQLSSEEQKVLWKKYFPGGVNLPLVDVPEASLCTGTVILQNDVTDSILVETQEMIPTIAAFGETADFLPKNAAEDLNQFQFNPHAISTSPGPLLKLLWRTPNISVPKAWIWNEFCQSQFFTNGRTLHSISFKIENIDAQELNLSIENSGKKPLHFLGVLVNGQQIPLESVLIQKPKEKDSTKEPISKNLNFVPDSVYRLSIPFPAWQRQNEIMVQWLEYRPVWSFFATLNPPQITSNLQVLQNTWKIWIPEKFVPLKNFSEDENWGKNQKMNEGRVKSYTTSCRDSLPLRLFGPLRLGQNIFSQPETRTLTKIESPTFLEPKSIERLSFWTQDGDSTNSSSFSTIFPDEYSAHSIAGWNMCTLHKKIPIFMLYGNLLEASRWFFLLISCFFTSWLLAPYRLVRVCFCGFVMVLCMILPLVWTPIFSGIFLGICASFINSSIRHHFAYTSTSGKPVIFVKSASVKND